ncbi:hypothetical protein LTR56_015174 [Elasticomyces elasticus]|nr:hypothetical protein LTR56_015174 [Elasticomyces elasticus]KAK3644468.1 hypothetical protein LTR22_015188 [Elasticomyces elasticus]KAK4915505.1 hypothetical protein LTR49_016352 [Elasticomyces elasticus]KAK5756222.1 hypothetical protein LTS12_013646 [Elasticomyces elasticus]
MAHDAYLLQPESECDLEKLSIKDRLYDRDFASPPKTPWLLLALAAVEIIQLMMIYNLYFLNVTRPTVLDEYGQLGQYTYPTAFTVDDESLVNDTAQADRFWSTITYGSSNGHVSLPLEFVEKYDLLPSLLKTVPGEAAYQVDAFHQLRRIRKALIHPAELPDNVHTLHCVDYIRQELMCNVDLTLNHQGIDRSSITGPPRMCRDFDAVRRWVLDHAWNATAFG